MDTFDFPLPDASEEFLLVNSSFSSCVYFALCIHLSGNSLCFSNSGEKIIKMYSKVKK